MASAPEQPSSRPQESRERPPVFHQALDAFEATVGPQVNPLPPEITLEWIDNELKTMAQDHRISSFNEQTRCNELLYRKAALQRMNDFQQGGARTPERVQELIVANQGVAFHEYYRSAQNQVVTLLRRYETIRSGMAVVSPEIQQMEADTQRYIAALNEATQERVVFSNILLIDDQLSRKFGDPVAQQALRQSLMQRLTPASRAVIGAGNDLTSARANQLNQRIIDILGGEHGIPGIERGFVPQRMFLALLKARYKQLLDQQIEIARDPNLVGARAERDRLLLKFETAQKGTGEFTAEDKARFDELERRLKDVNGRYDDLKKQRGVVTDQILTLTQDLGEYGIAQTELAAIQEQLGKRYSFEGVMGVSNETTPPDIRKGIAENMEMRKAHHLGQMGNFLERVDQQMLAKGLKEHLEQFWNVNGREGVRIFTHRLSSLFTLPVPETFGLKEAAQEALTQPLDEALGWPAGKDRWEQLNDNEKAEVRKRATSILDLIERFDRTKITNLRESVTLMQGMPPASQFTFDQVRFDESGQPVLPQGRVTLANREALIAQHGGATVYLMLMRQMQEDFGTADPAAGFMGEYARFLRGVNENIGTHIDVGRACTILSNRWADLMKLLIAAAIAIFVIGGVITVIAWEGGKLVVRRLLGGGGAAPSSGAAGAGAASAEGGAGTASTGEKVAEGAARTSRVGRVLGPLAIILVAADLRRVILRDARLQIPAEYEGITAAIEFMEGHPDVNRDVPRYRREVRYLQSRLQCFVMQDGSEKLTQAIQRAKKTVTDTALLQRAELVQDRCEQVRKHARQQKMRYERLFPITDYFVTDPNRPAGNIGVNFRQLDESRSRGMEAEDQERRSEELRGMELMQQRVERMSALRRTRDLTNYEDLNQEYRILLEDGAEVLELLLKKSGQ